MKIFLFTGVFLVTILNTVASNKNVSNESQNSYLTANENGTSIDNETKTENYNDFVDPELQEVWEKYLAEARIETKPKSTREMGRSSSVTKTIKAFRERASKQQEQKVTEREAQTIINLATKPGAESLGIANDNRRQLHLQKSQFAGAAEMQGAEVEETERFESYRQAYWKNGEYVYLRTGSPTTDGDEWTSPMDLFRGCDRTCNFYFKTYGRVCGHRYSLKLLENQYRTFDNICDIDHENCFTPRMRPNWHPLHRGNCTELEEFKEMEFDYHDIVERMKKWAPYSYVPPEPTESTTEPFIKHTFPNLNIL